MVQNPHDDYYKKIESSATQQDAGVEKKKIKIVAKKAAPVVPKESPEVVEKNVPDTYDTNQAVLQPEEPAPRTVKLPESDTLDLGTKFNRPAVVFHSHTSRPKLPSTSPRPASSGGGFQRPGNT